MSTAGTTRYLVKIAGCDATTRFTIALTAAEFAAVSRIAEATVGVSGCQPDLTLEDYTGVTIDEFDDIEEL